MKNHRDHREKPTLLGRSRFLGALLAAGLLPWVAGCGDLLEVSLPGDVTEDNLADPSLSEILVNSVIADFECAYNNYTFGASAHSDEMWHSSGNLTMRNWGLRRITKDDGNYVNGTCGGWGYGMWNPMHTARFQAEDVYQRISNFEGVENKDSKLATVLTYGAFMYTYLGETFCQMTIDGGPPQQPSEILAIAQERFESALTLAQSSGNTEMLNAVRVGLARVKRNLGDQAGARTLAEQVPDGFVLMATRGSDFSRRYNKGYNYFLVGRHQTVAPDFRDLEWKGVPDPRVEVYRPEGGAGIGFDGVTPLYASTKWMSYDTPIRIASWEEAQLIVAEAAAATGDEAAAVAIINELHDRIGLPPYDPAADGPVMDQVILERSRELFQEGGNRLNDQLRFGLPFFEGASHTLDIYGSTTCFPLPTVEGG